MSDDRLRTHDGWDEVRRLENEKRDLAESCRILTEQRDYWCEQVKLAEEAMRKHADSYKGHFGHTCPVCDLLKELEARDD